MLMLPEIKQGAIFIADAHESDKRGGFYRFLQKLESGEITTPQLFLMGDMFDLLIGEVEYSVKKHKKHIDLIDKIALHVEVLYFEGNHDFALDGLFVNTKVISIDQQPVKFALKGEVLAHLSHGDIFSGTFHTVFTKIVRSAWVLKSLNLVDRIGNYCISKRVERNQLIKDKCRKIENFKEIVSAKIPNYNALQNSYIIEGHHHQNQSFRVDKINYINLASFACNQSFFIVEYSNDKKFALRSCNA